MSVFTKLLNLVELMDVMEALNLLSLKLFGPDGPYTAL